jgi:hypothetical protein
MLIDNEDVLGSNAKEIDAYMDLIDKHFSNRKLRLQIFKNKYASRWKLRKYVDFELKRFDFEVDKNVLDAIIACEKKMG